MAKIDLTSNDININVLRAKLLIIQSSFNRTRISNWTSEEIKKWVANVVDINFITNDKTNIIITHLSLYLMGNENNCFDKLLKECENNQ